MDESKAVQRAVLGNRGESASTEERESAWRVYVRGCALREAAALGKLYDESASLVYGVALRVLANEADAEEVTLDVYTQVWRTASGYDADRGSVIAWLMSIARSRSIDKLRHRTSRTRLEEPLEVHHDPRTGAADPEEHTLMGQQRRRVLTAMEALSPDQRRSLELVYFSGLSHSELAARLGQPLGTVKTWVRSGMIKMRELLGTEA